MLLVLRWLPGKDLKDNWWSPVPFPQRLKPNNLAFLFFIKATYPSDYQAGNLSAVFAIALQTHCLHKRNGSKRLYNIG